MYNKITLLGHLSKDITIRYTQGGSAVASTAIATTRKFKSTDGTQKEEVLFVDITFFGRTAEVVNQYLHKGSKLLIDGRLKLEQWTDQQGQKRSKHTVQVESLTMLDTKEGSTGSNQPRQEPDSHTAAHKPPQRAASREAYPQAEQSTEPTQAPQFPQMEDDDEIPF